MTQSLSYPPLSLFFTNGGNYEEKVQSATNQDQHPQRTKCVG